MQIAKYIITGLLCLPILPSTPNGRNDYLSKGEELEERILQFRDEYVQLQNASSLQIRITESNLESGSFMTILREKVRVLDAGLQSIDFRWNAFTQLEQADLAEDEDLMEQMTQVQNLRKVVADTIAAGGQKCDAIADFIAAEHFILAQDSIYAKLYRHAKFLSQTKKTAPQLEKVKAHEQTLFTKLKEHYDKSKAAATLVPQLGKRATVIDEHFYSLKALDEKIQTMKYQSLIARTKDYLMGLACVAVILIFFNMLITKMQAAKKARQMLKKQKDMLNKASGNEYPTI